MKAARFALLGLCGLLLGCQSSQDKAIIGELSQRTPDLTEYSVDDSLVRAMAGYQRFLEETPSHAMAPEAMRRLADLQIEKEFGVVGDTGAAELIELPAPARVQARTETLDQVATAAEEQDWFKESVAQFELRAAAPDQLATVTPDELSLPNGSVVTETAGLEAAIQTYEKILAEYPWYERNDQVLYQMARAYDELGQPAEAMQVVERLISEYPQSRYVDEVFFRRGEYHFVRREYLKAEEAYLAVVGMGERSSFYELALYKLGWAFYKQELYEEALHQYVALLDYKLSSGFDFDADYAQEDEGEERRVADTFRVISLSFSNLGDADVVRDYFSAYGNRSFEDRIYRNLAEFHFDKRRFNDAAETYGTFVSLYPFHEVSPHFGMRVSEIYAEGNFPLLVVEAKKDFATRYGMHAEYWHYFHQAERPDVLDYLKSNLIDLANHYHALYQEEQLAEEQPANYAQALRWYEDFLGSFPEDEQSPAINFQLADLLLEQGEFGKSARQYERTAYDYPAHDKAAQAGYAAVYAYRQYLEVVTGAEIVAAKQATVDSSLRFADTFPAHEHAPPILGAATEDLYAMQDFERAIASGRWLIEEYPDADAELRRTGWLVVAHASFDTADYPQAEEGYDQVLLLTGPDDGERQAVTDNLAAAIYKQGEQARALEDYVTAADHFLRVKKQAPSSAIRPAAEYDAAAALLHLEDWLAAAEVLEAFRADHPDHELNQEATRQLAATYEKGGELEQAALEYEQVAADADSLEMRREALLVAGDLYEKSGSEAEAVRVYLGYIEEFPGPLETAVEIRFKVAGNFERRGAMEDYRGQLRAIVEADANAGNERTDRTRYLAAQSSLVLTQPLYEEFARLELNQPFEDSLARKKTLMATALAECEALVAYEVSEVTAAATYYLAEIYRNFSQALLDSERPVGLSAADLAAYEMVIEEEAYPFEEQSIAVHEENLELIRTGVLNGWVQKSLDELALLMPARYAKSELSSGFVGNIDHYAYQAPFVPEPVPEVSGQELGMRSAPAAQAGEESLISPTDLELDDA